MNTQPRTSNLSIRRIAAGAVLGLGATVALAGPLSSTAGALPPGGFPDLDDLTVETIPEPPITVPPTVPPTTPPWTIPPVIADPSTPPTTVAPDPDPEPTPEPPASEPSAPTGGAQPQDGGGDDAPAPQVDQVEVDAVDVEPTPELAAVETADGSTDLAAGPRDGDDDGSGMLLVAGVSVLGAGALMAGGLAYDRRRRSA